LLKKSRKLLLILMLVLPQAFYFKYEAQAQSIPLIDYSQIADQDFVQDELIIQYHRNTNLISSLLNKTAEEEQNFFAKLNINYDIWSEASHDEQLTTLRDKIKKFRKNGKLKKLKKAKKLKKTLKSAYAVLKLDHAVTSSELTTLIKKMNLDHYNTDNFEIDAVFPNYLYEVTGSGTNDPLNSQQFSHDSVKPQALWNYTKGAGVVVAVIDTGIDWHHEDLAANIWVNTDEIPGNGKDDDNNGYVDDVRGWDFINAGNSSCSFNEDCTKEDNDPNDVNGHGTHVAGIIAAVGNNGIGTSGIAPEAKIMPLKAGFSTGSSAFLQTDDIIQAITYAIDNDADVINMSFAGYGLNVLSSLLTQANNQGIICVAAAGNNSSNTPIYPAAISSVIAVGATADGVSKASFSNYGNWVDITAPGSWILSTVPNNGYDHKSGTSMASPIVAGVAALLKAKNPGSSSSAIKKLLFDNTTKTTFYIEQGGTEYLGGVSAEIIFPFEIVNSSVPSSAILGEALSFSASASEAVVEYEWISSIDGFLSSAQSFSISNLSLGTHIISVRAKNSNGVYTASFNKTLVISEEKIIDPNDNGGIDPNDNGDKVISPLSQNIRIKKRDNRFYASMSRNTRKQLRAFRWSSSVDGVVSNKRGFYRNRLSSGSHVLSLEVQDKNGNWTNPLQRTAFKFGR
jgi:subtilisin family serine protease